MTQEILIKNIPLSYLKEKPVKFFKSEEFSKFGLLFDKFKEEIDLSSEEVEDYEILPLNELKSFLLNKYLLIDDDIQSIKEKEDLMFVRLSGKTISGLDFVQKKFITSSMSDLKSSLVYFISPFLNNNIYLNAYNNGLNKAKQKGNSTALEELLKPKESENVSLDIANTSNFYDSINDSTVYDSVAYENLLRLKDIKDSITVNNDVTPFKLNKNKIDELEVYNSAELRNKLNGLRYKLFNKYFNQKHKYQADSDIFNEDTVPPTDILLSLIARKNREFPINVFREILINQADVTIRHNLKNTDFKYYIFDKTSGKDITSSTIDTITHSDNNTITNITFNNVVNGELLVVSDKYTFPRIHQATLFDYYALSNIDNNIERYTTFINRNKIILDLAHYDKGYAVIEVMDKDNKIPIVPDEVTITNKTVELTFSFDLEYIPVNVYVLPTFKVISNINIIKVSCSNIYKLLENINPFDNSVKAWRNYSND